jgi:hypothetical protein
LPVIVAQGFDQRGTGVGVPTLPRVVAASSRTCQAWSCKACRRAGSTCASDARPNAPVAARRTSVSGSSLASRARAGRHRAA